MLRAQWLRLNFNSGNCGAVCCFLLLRPVRRPHANPVTLPPPRWWGHLKVWRSLPSHLGEQDEVSVCWTENDVGQETGAQFWLRR